MNTVLNSYGQLYGCPEILKKVINFFVVGLTYGWHRQWYTCQWLPSPMHYMQLMRTVKRMLLKCWRSRFRYRYVMPLPGSWRSFITEKVISMPIIRKKRLLL